MTSIIFSYESLPSFFLSLSIAFLVNDPPATTASVISKALLLLAAFKFIHSNPPPDMEELAIGKIKFTIQDLGGHQQGQRQLWCDYFPEVDAIIFLVDSADFQQFSESKVKLDGMYQTTGKGKIPLNNIQPIKTFMCSVIQRKEYGEGAAIHLSQATVNAAQRTIEGCYTWMLSDTGFLFDLYILQQAKYFLCWQLHAV
ncbi:ARF/SAR protein [Mycena venus]|uniref:ARF/SAR protein n=1 Tax=Mycena venus TaxID=2733690 RepID=A0A8H6Z092_9AGAR|nr:ARF/SAR protein [Mycena venus]